MGGSNKQTSTSTSEPYKASKPLLDKGMGDALKLYNDGGLVKPNTMSTVVPYAQQTTQGMGDLTNIAQNNMGGQGLSGQMQNIINSGGFNSAQQNALSGLTSMANSSGYNQEQQDALSGFRGTIGSGGYNSAQQGALSGLQGIVGAGGYNDEQRAALEGVRNTATGEFDINANPAFQQVLQRAQSDALNAVNQNAAGLGRYGSGTHDGVTTREIGDLTARMVGNEYNNWQNRRDAAQNQLFGMGQTGLGNVANAQNQIFGMGQTAQGNVANALQGLAAVGQQGQANVSNAQQQLFNAGQQGQQNLGNAYELAQDPAKTLMGVGGMYEDLYGRTLNDQLRIANERSNAPLANIQSLLAVANGGGQYGTNTQTAQGPNNALSNIAGAGLGTMSMMTNGGSKPKL